MADQPIVHIGENSPEHVAYKLLQDVMHAENVTIHSGSRERRQIDRKYLLDTYAECLLAVRAPYDRAPD